MTTKYDPNKTYKLGDKVEYNGDTYTARCSVPPNTDPALRAGKWSKVAPSKLAPTPASAPKSKESDLVSDIILPSIIATSLFDSYSSSDSSSFGFGGGDFGGGGGGGAD